MSIFLSSEFLVISPVNMGTAPAEPRREDRATPRISGRGDVAMPHARPGPFRLSSSHERAGWIMSLSI